MSCQRNRTSFVSLELRVSVIWRVLLVWLWWKHRVCGLQSPWTSHFGLSYRFLVSFVHVVPHRFKILPSYFFLRVRSTWSDTCCVFILPFHGFCAHHSFNVTPSFPWSSSFFILLKINTRTVNISNLSSINLVSIFRCSSPPHNLVYGRRVDPSALAFSLSSHRHSYTSSV